MSKQKIAPTRGEGISTPQIIAANPQSGNTFSAAAFAEALDAAINDHAVMPMCTAVEALGWLSTLCAVIKDTAEDGLAVPPKKPNAERLALCRIKDLGDIGHYLANDVGNFIDCEREDLRDEHLPRLLAALPNGGAE